MGTALLSLFLYNVGYSSGKHDARTAAALLDTPAPTPAPRLTTPSAQPDTAAGTPTASVTSASASPTVRPKPTGAPPASILAHGELIPSDLPSDSGFGDESLSLTDDTSQLLMDGVGQAQTLCAGKVIAHAKTFVDDYSSSYASSSLGSYTVGYATDIASFNGTGAAQTYQAIRDYARDCSEIRISERIVEGCPVVKLSSQSTIETSFGNNANTLYREAEFARCGSVIDEVVLQSTGGNHSLVADVLLQTSLKKLNPWI